MKAFTTSRFLWNDIRTGWQQWFYKNMLNSNSYSGVLWHLSPVRSVLMPSLLRRANTVAYEALRKTASINKANRHTQITTH
ncbi:hypothetical protein KIN20_009885 [Parelaphostrongylus tenuis]|uniref:Uncharacterized protein n=1 Tax=Parelaphostrongylus tenuis TaxID=148309 RepID=A0AAD5MR59_PARTN|nr:hypothetical protein KIN20_009885 [Parelaphostrongylus tenuis]